MARCILLSTTVLSLTGFAFGSSKKNLTNHIYLKGNEENNCTLSSIEHFPNLPLPGGAILSTSITLLTVTYLILFLVKICDHYFVSTIKLIGKKIGLSSDVAGASLMAAAVSCPDLFMNTIGTFVTEGDIGIGTVVGCGLFNTLAVPALCALLTPTKQINLNGWSLTRDSIFYTAALITLTLSLNDNIIEWHEGIVFLAIYFVYILFLCWNNKLRTQMETFINYCSTHFKRRAEKKPLLLKSHSILSYGGDEDIYRDYPEDGIQLVWGMVAKIYMYPIDLLLGLTIPPPNKEIYGYKLYPLSFVMSLAWIGMISYVIAWMITIAGYELRIPDSFVGLTFIAIGMSIPEAASSVIVARRGDGSMALSCSMGSSIFDTLVCLGLPWLLRAALSENHHVIISSKGIAYTAILLIASILIMYISIAINKFKINATVGYICLVMYIIFAILSALLEMNIFFEGNLPMC